MNNAEVSKGDTGLNFEEFCGDALGILLYGSHAQGCWSERSGIDICIVQLGNDYVLRRINKKLGVKYDAKVFEKMPLYIWIEIIHNHQIIYGDAVEIGAYFYRFGRLWVDRNRGFEITGLAAWMNEWLCRGSGCVRRERYLEILEVFEGELNFIESHQICDDVTEKALFHSLQVCVEVHSGHMHIQICG